MGRIFALFLFLTVLSPHAPALAGGPGEAAYGALLAANVRDGLVDYPGIKAQESVLDSALAAMAAIDPQTLSRQDSIAYYINVYNAWTIKLVIGYVPGIRSIKEAGNLLRSPWKRKIVRLAAGTVSLDEIEHDILRRRYGDARLHFVLNCASKSCPPLAEVPYRGRTLEADLDARTRSFVNNAANSFVADGRLHVSRIFDWYAEDFAGPGGVWAWIRGYADPPLAAAMDAVTDRRLVFTDYDWSLNAQPLPRPGGDGPVLTAPGAGS
ncbi:DUF547 domain-containing protein [Solidesulfovibrio sp.]